MMASDPPVTLRHVPNIGMDPVTEGEVAQRRIRPKSASYEALRSAVSQLTSMADFKVEELLGSGFFADVYKVKRKSNGEQMVLKMNKSKKTSKTMLAEIQLLNRLSHPNILRFKGSCVHEGQLHALTEYINGGSLEEMLMDESIHLSWSVRLQIARDIVRGMVYLHSRSVFHRDLNPKNCLIQRERDGRIITIVADFGLAAKIKQRRRRSHTETVGSAYWMAPECLYGKSYCEQADVFSFGITLAEIIARIPADPDYIPRTMDFGLDMVGLRLLCPDCPASLLELAEKCCQIEPDERPSFEEVLEFLEELNLPSEFLEENEEVGGGRISTASSQKDLRSSVSEPILRVSDSISVEDTDDVKSCDDEGGLGRFLVRSLRLDSVGSSNGSSFGSGLDDGCSYGLDLEKSNEESSFSGYHGTNLPEEDEKWNKETSESFSSLQENGALLGKENISAVISAVIDSKLPSIQLLQSANDKERKTITNIPHLPQKSLSLDNSASEENGPLNRLEPRGRERTPSMQTLLASEGVLEGDGGISGKHRGGDSGIDPGEVDVFKFPPQQQLQQQQSTSSSTAENSVNPGDHTPICCTSPEPLPKSADSNECGPVSPSRHIIAESDASRKGIPISLVLSPPNLRECAESNVRSWSVEAIRGTSNPSPAHSSFSHSRTSSTDTSQPDTSLLATLRERSQSPLEQSWASSECSFTLPSPSTPWAPPSSPVPPHSRHSLPSSPPHRHSPYQTYRRHHSPPVQSKPRNHPHRYSQDITAQPPCLRKTSSSRRPKSCRNSALFSGSHDTIGNSRSSIMTDLQLDFERLAKTVHFVGDNYAVDYDDDPNMSLRESYARREGMARQRSKSSPSWRMRKTSASFIDDTKNGKSLREYGISLQTDLLDFDATCTSKYYKITQTSNTRLSSSTPDLSKLSLHSAPC